MACDLSTYFSCPIAKPLMNGFYISRKMIAGGGIDAIIAASMSGPYVNEQATQGGYGVAST